jgi:hypothetical protein
VRWEQCKEIPIVMLQIREDDGKIRNLPACNTCWQECISTKVKILKVTPIKSKKGQKHE